MDMKKVSFFLFLLCLVITGFAQQKNDYDKALINLIEAFVDKPANVESYLIDHVVLVNTDEKKLSIKEYKVYGMKFLICEVSDEDKTKAYLDVTKLHVGKRGLEAEMVGVNGVNIKISTITLNDESKEVKKEQKEEVKKLETLFSYLLNPEENHIEVLELIEDDILYVDHINKNHSLESLVINGKRIKFINPSKSMIEECGNKYIQLIDYDIRNSMKSIEIHFRIINGDQIQSMRIKCTPCKAYF
jgi:hypothetical protein